MLGTEFLKNDGGGFGPEKRLGISIVFFEIAFDDGLQLDDQAENSVPDALPGELGEEVFDGVEPGTRGPREVKCPARMAGEPSQNLRMLVGRVVVGNGVDQFSSRHDSLDGVEKADEVLMGMALHAPSDDRPVQNIERGKQGSGAVTNIIMRHAFHIA